MHHVDLIDSQKPRPPLGLARNSLDVWPLIFLLVGIISSPASTARADITLQHLYTLAKHDGSLGFQVPSSVCFVSGRKEILVSDAGAGTVVVLGENGDSRGYFYHRRKGQDKNSEPIGLAVDSHQTVYVTDSSTDKVWTYDYLGNQLGYLPMPSVKDVPALPGKMTFDAVGNLYVAVRNSGRLVVFDRDNHLKAEIDVPDVQVCSGVAVDKNGMIYVLSLKGPVVQRLDKNGRLIGCFGSHNLGPDGFSGPSGIDIDGRGRLWIVDSLRQVIKVFNHDGSFVQMLGGIGSGDGEFFFPVDLCIDGSDNTLFVIEKSGQRLQAFRIMEK